jgi:HD-like signal output (HDOD) protein
MAKNAVEPAAAPKNARPTIARPPRKSDAAAHAFLNRLADELAEGPLNLPCFPDVVPRIRKALSDPNSTLDDIVRMAGTEPRLAARLLQTANAALFNPTGTAVTDLRRAVNRLGHDLVESVTMAFALAQVKAEPALQAISAQLNALWLKSIAAASICRVLAKRLGVPHDKVFLTGLLHGIGYFYIMVRAGEAGMKIEDLLTDFVAQEHPTIGRCVMQKWGFEAVMCEAVRHQNDRHHNGRSGADITDVVIASVLLAGALVEHGGDLQRCAEVTSIANLSLTPDDLEAIMRHTQTALSALRHALEA